MELSRSPQDKGLPALVHTFVVQLDSVLDNNEALNIPRKLVHD